MRNLLVIMSTGLLLAANATVADADPASMKFWLAGVDPAVQARKHIGEPADYMDLFQPKAPWTSAASNLDVFLIGTEMALRGSDDQLRAVIEGLKARHIKLAISMGLIGGERPDGCGKGVEGYSAPKGPEAAARRIQALGGEIDYIAMDEPVWFGHAAGDMSGGRRGCRYTLGELTDKIAPQLEMLRGYFPNVGIGEIEPISSSPHARSQDPHFLEDVRAFGDLLQTKANMKLAFLHADVAWKWEWRPGLEDMARQSHARGIRFGVICDGDVDAGGDAAWVQQALQRCREVASNPKTFPDNVIVQTWEPLPTKMLPETDPGALTYELGRLESMLSGGARKRPDQGR